MAASRTGSKNPQNQESRRQESRGPPVSGESSLPKHKNRLVSNTPQIHDWAVTFIPMPVPKPVCRTLVDNKRVQYEVCRTFRGMGMGMNIAAQ